MYRGGRARTDADRDRDADRNWVTGTSAYRATDAYADAYDRTSAVGSADADAHSHGRAGNDNPCADRYLITNPLACSHGYSCADANAHGHGDAGDTVANGHRSADTVAEPDTVTNTESDGSSLDSDA